MRQFMAYMASFVVVAVISAFALNFGYTLFLKRSAVSGVDFPERIRESASIVRDPTERQWVDQRDDGTYQCTTVDARTLTELTTCTLRP